MTFFKVCTKCKEEKTKTIENFRFHKSDGGYWASRCRKCENLKSALWRKNNKEKFKILQQTRQKKHKNEIDKLKSVPCADCKIQYSAHIMQFDHLPQFEKKFDISKDMKRKLTLLLEEAAKCEVVCANCHADRTYKRLKGLI